MINSKFDTSIVIDKVDLSSLRNLNLKNLLIKDHYQDTLIYVGNLSTSVLNFRNIISGHLLFGDIDIENGIFLLKTYEGEKMNNLNIFSSKFMNESNSNNNKFKLSSTSVHLNNVRFTLIDENRSLEPIVYYDNISGFFDNFHVDGPEVRASIHDLQAAENHQINIVKFKTDFLYTNTRMEFLETELLTENSKLTMNIVFNYEEGDLSNFTNKVAIEAHIEDSDIALIDLNKLYDEFGKNDLIHLNTNIYGTINDFVLTEFDMHSNRNMELQGIIHLKNITDNKKLNIKADLKKIKSNYKNLSSLFPNLLGKKLPPFLDEIGDFTSLGKINISGNSIYSRLRTKCDIGLIKTDIKLNNLDKGDNMNYTGLIEFQDFNLGKIVGDTLIGELSMVGEIEGQGIRMNNINTKLKGNISKHQYKGYTYSNIYINGLLKDKNFNGVLNVDDPNIKLVFKGLADLSGTNYKFDFDADVEYADFYNLNLFTRDEKSILKGKIDINLTGIDLDNIIGEISFTEATYINQNDSYYFKDFKVSSVNKDSIRELRISSTDIINGLIKGNFKFNELKKLTKNSLGSLFVNYQKDEVSKGQFLEFNFNIYNKIVEVFFPDVKLGANTIIRGEMNSDLDALKLSIKSPEVVAFDNNIENIRLQIDNHNPLYHTILSIDKVNTEYYNIGDVNLVSVTLNDTLFIRTDFIGGKELKEKYNLSFYHTFNEKNQSVFGIKKSEIVFKDNIWRINPNDNSQNKFVFDQSFNTYAIDNINMTSGNQHIDLAGLVFDKDNRNIDLKFENVNLNDITPKIDSVQLDGKINGTINLKRVSGKTLPFADLTINYFSINDDYYGDLTINAFGDETIKNYSFEAALFNGDLNSFLTMGQVDFNPAEPTISAEVSFDKFDLSAFSPLGKDVISKIRGIASGDAMITGILRNPKIEGEINLIEAGIALPYLNVNYSFLDKTKVKLYDQTFDFLNISVQDDVMKTKGTISGTISHENFKKWDLDLDLVTKNLLVLNTKEKENVLYYGTGLISGRTSLFGPTDDLTIDVQGKTNPGTEFVIPLSYLSTISDINLIHFENPVDENEVEEKSKDVVFENLKGLTINFKLEVTKDAIAQVVVDKTSGSLLRGSGVGDLEMNIDTNGKFDMYGALTIDNGEYQFKNIINKDFVMKKGGTIVWNGNPFDAELNIEAINITKANPSVLLDEINSSRKIEVELITYITGTLSEAKFEFDINIPNASSLVSSELEFKLNSDDEKLTQFFSLLATGSFINADLNNADFGNAALSGTIAQKASNILSQILKSTNEDIQVGVTYDVGKTNSVEDVITDDQLGIEISGRIADKVTVNGKVGVPVGSNTSTSIIGEVEIIVPLNEAETLSAKVYNRQNEIQFDVVEGEGYTQGVGVSYQFDFDNGNEFLNKLGMKRSVEQKELNKKKNDSLKAIRKSKK